MSISAGSAFFPQSVASGDPGPNSVILWTRVDDPTAGGDLDLELVVARDEALADRVALGEQATVRALARYDRCARVRVRGLDPATTYYYRFVYTKGGARHASRTGRTRTAPAPDADVPVRFAFVSCQDYVGRFFNAYVALAQEDLDFVVHLGDYIYETTCDPRFQCAAAGRSIAFADEAGALALSTERGEPFFAARSLDNYRQLYRTYRTDAALQAVHERFPMIACWDDHEFSDDCWGASGVYLDGRRDETDVARRKAANQAWFEYQPVDYAGDEGFQYDASAAFPGDIRVHRDLAFGKHVHLVLTDLRTYRADHLIPEDALPGAICLDAEALAGAPSPRAQPYVDVDAYQGGAYEAALQAAAGAAGFDAAKITGDVSVAFVNALAVQAGLAPIDPASPGLPRGLAYADLGKTRSYSPVGSRYLVDKDVFDRLSAVTYARTRGASGEVMGAAQEAWFLETMTASTATWKIWANEYCLAQLAVDLAAAPIPEELQRRFYLSCDGWDGFRDKRAELVAKLSAVGGVVAITGDIHAFFAGTPATDDPAQKIVELVGSSVSTVTLRSLVTALVAGDPTLREIPLAAELAASIEDLLLTSANPHLACASSAANGFVVVEASAGELVATFHAIPEGAVTIDFTGKPAELAAIVQKTRLRVLPGENELYREIEGAWRRWDPATRSWV